MDLESVKREVLAPLSNAGKPLYLEGGSMDWGGVNISSSAVTSMFMGVNSTYNWTPWPFPPEPVLYSHKNISETFSDPPSFKEIPT